MRLNVSRDDFNDDELVRASASIRVHLATLGAQQHRMMSSGAYQLAEELHKDEHAISFILGLLQREQVERRKDDLEMAKP